MKKIFLYISHKISDIRAHRKKWWYRLIFIALFLLPFISPHYFWWLFPIPLYGCFRIIYHIFTWIFGYKNLPRPCVYTPINIIVGRPGTGKTVCSAALAYKFNEDRKRLLKKKKAMRIWNNQDIPYRQRCEMMRKFTKRCYFRNITPDSVIFSNYPIDLPNVYFLKWSDIGIYDCPYGSIYLMDEVGQEAGNRSWMQNFAGAQGELLDIRLHWLRHYHCQMFLIIQNPCDLDTKIYRLQPEVWVLSRSMFNIFNLIYRSYVRITVYYYKLTVASDVNLQTGNKTTVQAFNVSVRKAPPVFSKNRGFLNLRKYWNYIDSWLTIPLPEAPLQSYDVAFAEIRKKAEELLEDMHVEQIKQSVKRIKDREKAEKEYEAILKKQLSNLANEVVDNNAEH